MPLISQITPSRRNKVIDLVRQAGIDVSRWSDYKNGATNPAANPKYCYEWAFIEPGKVAVLNLWLQNMQESDDTFIQELDLRERASQNENRARATVWGRRADSMEAIIKEAYINLLPVRVIICKGRRRDAADVNAKSSNVTMRLLDTELWAVTAYDAVTGRCILTRGALPLLYADQFTVNDKDFQEVEKRQVQAIVFVRKASVRFKVLARAKGRCEWCGMLGFQMDDGRIFLETHHVISLAQNGADIECNVVALCPTHHREAHHGKNRIEMRKVLLARFSIDGAAS